MKKFEKNITEGSGYKPGAYKIHAEQLLSAHIRKLNHIIKTCLIESGSMGMDSIHVVQGKEHNNTRSVSNLSEKFVKQLSKYLLLKDSSVCRKLSWYTQ
jgi:putative heme iron utilization protein